MYLEDFATETSLGMRGVVCAGDGAYEINNGLACGKDSFQLFIFR